MSKPTDETFDPLAARKIKLCGDYFSDCNLMADVIAQDMKAYEELERERNELATQVDRLKNERDEALAYIENLKKITGCIFPKAEGEGVDICDADGEDWRKALMLRPPEALPALKAQLRSEAFSAFVSTLENIKNEAECSDDTLVKMMVEFSIRVAERYLANVTRHAHEVGQNA